MAECGKCGLYFGVIEGGDSESEDNKKRAEQARLGKEEKVSMSDVIGEMIQKTETDGKKDACPRYKGILPGMWERKLDLQEHCYGNRNQQRSRKLPGLWNFLPHSI